MLKSLFTSKVFKETSTFSYGIVIGNIITIIVSTMLTRIYEPEQIGYISLFNSLAVVLASTFTLSYDHAIVVAKSEKESNLLTLLSESFLVIGAAFVLLIVSGIYLFNVETYIEFPRIWLLFVPLGILALGGINIFNSWFVDQKRFTVTSNNKIVSSSVTGILQLIIGLGGFLKWGLLIGYLSGRIFALVHFLKNSFRNYKRHFELKPLIQIAKKYQQYPTFITPTVLIDRLSIEAPFFLIALLFTSEDVGFFTIAYKTLGIPMAFLGLALGQILFKNFALLVSRSKPMTRVLIKNWFILAILGITPTLIISIFAKDLFPIVFGKEYILSGKFAILLAPMVFLDFISSPTGRTFLVLKLEHLTTVFSSFRFIYTILSFFIGYLYSDIFLSILLFSIFRGIGLIVQNLIMLSKIRKYDLSLKAK